MGLNNPGGCKGAVIPIVHCHVVNGGFETGDATGWTASHDVTCTAVTIEPQEGAYHGRIFTE